MKTYSFLKEKKRLEKKHGGADAVMVAPHGEAEPQQRVDVPVSIAKQARIGKGIELHVSGKIVSINEGYDGLNYTLTLENVKVSINDGTNERP